MSILVDDLARFVSTPSVTGDEAALGAMIAETVERLGLIVQLVESLPGRVSVGARLPGSHEGPVLVLNGHLDTVPVGDASQWTYPPFGAEISGDLLFGRGACDMKAGLAVMVDVARRLTSSPTARHGSLVLHFAIGEERAEPGTRSLIEAGFVGDIGITLEPTGLRVATAQRGGGVIRIGLAGRAAHAGTREQGENAIEKLPAALTVIAEYDDALGVRSHPLLGRPTATPTMIRAGEASNVVPAWCEIVVDRRLIPGESIHAEVCELQARFAAASALGRSASVSGTPHFEGSVTPATCGFAERVRAAARAERIKADARPWGTPYASDVGCLINEAGIEAITFGPGDIRNAHANDEHVNLAEVQLATRVVERVATELFAGA
jgi:succinyl-diaminopimelate desuccinylase